MKVHSIFNLLAKTCKQTKCPSICERIKKLWYRNTKNPQRILETPLCTQARKPLEDMNKFLGMYTLSRLNQEEPECLNRPMTSSKTESLIKRLPQEKA